MPSEDQRAKSTEKPTVHPIPGDPTREEMEALVAALKEQAKKKEEEEKKAEG